MTTTLRPDDREEGLEQEPRTEIAQTEAWIAEELVVNEGTMSIDTSTTRDATTADPTAIDLISRPRRLRRTPALRSLVRETRLHPSMLVQPLFVRPGSGIREPISSLAGQARLSVDEAVVEAERLAELGVGGIILFGLPDAKDDEGSGAWIEEGIVQQTLRRLRDRALPLVLIADTCLCEYTTHGHCGPLMADGTVANDPAVARLAQAAVSQVRAGADIVAPSAMMDGQVAGIRRALDAAGYGEAAIMAYAAKAASAFYGPFREAADSAPSFGDRRGYQMDPSNGREAMREMALDVAEGADMLLVKPAMPQLDQIAAARARFDLPIAAYQVSGEYAMLTAAAERGWLDGQRAMLEAVTGIVRAGAGIVITYAAADIATWLRDER
jgi:porphobilinogen synthase